MVKEEVNEVEQTVPSSPFKPVLKDILLLENHFQTCQLYENKLHISLNKIHNIHPIKNIIPKHMAMALLFILWV
jgi:hypothetical protein